MTTPDPAAIQHITSLLSVLTQPNTDAIRQAESLLKPLLKQPQTMEILWHIITATTSSDPTVRHVAAIVLRKRLPGHFDAWDANTQHQWQHHVLQTILSEQVRPVRTALIAVAATLFRNGPPTPTILEFLTGAVNAGGSAREAAYCLLSEMTIAVGEHWKAHAPALAQLLHQALQPPTEAATQRAAVQALGQLLSFWSDDPTELNVILPLLPPMLQVAATKLDDDDLLTSVLEVLYDLAYSTHTLEQLPVTLEFCWSLLSNRSLDVRIRDSAALGIATNAETKPKSFAKQTALVQRMVDTLFSLMQESTASAAGSLLDQSGLNTGGDDDDYDDEDDGPTEMSMAQGTLDSLACELPTNVMWEICYPKCVALCQSPEPNARKAGVAGLGVITEGCALKMVEQLATIVPAVLALAQDAAPPVRECACFCLGQVAEHCQPEILEYSAEILPRVFGLLDDATPSVQTTSCYVLEIFCERLEPAAVRPVLDALVRKLGSMLEHVTGGRVQEMAVAAMAATAVAAEKEFQPYIANVVQVLRPYLSMTTENAFTLRGRALECMGHMAIAVGKEAFRPYLEATVTCAMEGLQFDSTDLQEFAFAVFANLAKIMEDEFAPALPQLVPFLVNILEQDEGQLEKANNTDTAGFDGLDESDDEDDENNMVLRVRTALLDVKKGAITALGEFACHTGTHFCPHLEATLRVFQQAAKNWHPLIKLEVAENMSSLVKPSVVAYHNGKVDWTKGDTASNPLSSHTQAIANAVLQELITMAADEELTVVSKALDGIQEVIELCGPSILVPRQQELMGEAHKVLTKAAPCQTPNPLFEIVEDDDEDCGIVVQSASNLVASFARLLGPQFVQFLPQFLPPIIEYTKPSKTPSERSTAIGCLSELVEELEAGILPHWPTVFLPVCLEGLADGDPDVKRNAAYTAGICCQHLQQSVTGDYHRILQGLSPLFGLSDFPGTVDNAAAALSRMIMASPNHVTPMEQVLPVLCQALPLKIDMTENETVYKCLTGLLQMQHPAVNKAELSRIFAAACAPDSKVEVEIQTKLREAQSLLQ